MKTLSGTSLLGLVFLILFSVFSEYTFAASPLSLTYQGRIIRPDGTPLDSSNVRFTIEIKSHNDCLLYKEVQSLNMSTAGGVFSLNIGTAPNPQTFNYVGSSLATVFTNNGTFTGLSGCTGGNYTPNADDNRQIVVSFEDLTLAIPTMETIPVQTVSYVPFAIESYQISGYTSNNLLRVDGGTASALTPANFTELLALLNGTSTQYVTAANNGVTSIVFSGGDFTGGTITSTGTVALKDVVVGATKGTATKIPQITYDNKGRVTAVTEVDITGIAPSGTAGGDLSGTYPNPTVGAGKIDTAKLADDSVTSAKIKDGEIVNADISATAGIVDTKLATLATAGKVANSATTGTSTNSPNTLVLRDNNGDFASRNISSNQINSNETYVTDLYLRNGSNFTAKFNLNSGAAANFNVVWPDNTNSSGKILSNDGSGNLSWISAGAGGSVTSVTAGTGLNVGAGPGGTISTSGTLNVNVGVGANQIVQLNGSSQLPALDASLLTNLNPTNLSAVVPISKGGTGQSSQTAAFNALSPLTTKGDLSTHDGTNNIRLPAGADFKYLRANSAQTSGLEYSDVTAVDLTSLSSTGIVKRTGAGAYATLGVQAPLVDTGTNLGLTTGNGLTVTAGALVVNAGTGANQIPQLNGSGKLNVSVMPSGMAPGGVGSSGNTRSIQFNNNGSFGGNTYFFYDELNHRINIGDDTSGTNAGIFFRLSGTNVGTYINASGAGTMSLAAGSLTRMTILPAGNVGIGTATPAYKLDVAGDVNVTGNFKINGTNIGSGTLSGAGTTNQLAKYTSANTLGNSLISDDGSNINVVAASGTNTSGTVTIRAGSTSSAGSSASGVSIYGGAATGNGFNSGGSVSLYGGNSITSGSGGSVFLIPGLGPSVGADGNVLIGTPRSATASNNYAAGVQLAGVYWQGSWSAQDTWQIAGVLGSGTNPSTTLTFSHPSGTTGSTSYAFPSGNVGMGVTTPTAPLDVESTNTATSGTNYNTYSVMSVNPSASSTATSVGVGGGAMTKSGSTNTTDTVIGVLGWGDHWTSNTLPKAIGVEGVADNGWTGTISTAVGTQGLVSNKSTGTITTAMALYSGITNSGGGTINTGYGLYIDTLSATTKYGLYQFDTGAMNYFGGKLGVGNNAPSYKLDVTGDVNATGCVRAGGSVLGGTCASDLRLKTDIQNFDLGLDALLGISPKLFKYNGLGEHPISDKPELGVIAQEVEKTAPQLIVTKDVKLHPEDMTTTTIKQVNYTAFIYVVINSVKELYQNILGIQEQQNQQTRDIASLKEQISTLKMEKENKDHELKEVKSYLCTQDPHAPFCQQH